MHFFRLFFGGFTRLKNKPYLQSPKAPVKVEEAAAAHCSEPSSVSEPRADADAAVINLTALLERAMSDS